MPAASRLYDCPATIFVSELLSLIIKGAAGASELLGYTVTVSAELAVQPAVVLPCMQPAACCT
jgi:hypothetical protein